MCGQEYAIAETVLYNKYIAPNKILLLYYNILIRLNDFHFKEKENSVLNRYVIIVIITMQLSNAALNAVGNVKKLIRHLFGC